MFEEEMFGDGLYNRKIYITPHMTRIQEMIQKEVFTVTFVSSGMGK
jgi:hypothetical protein